MRETRRLILYYSSTIAAVMGILATMVSFGYILNFNIDLLRNASSALAGAIAAASIAFFIGSFTRRYRKRVFISYSHHDSDFVLKLANDLKESGVNPIIDLFELRVGDNIKDAVDRMIDISDCFVFVASENNKNSSWAKQEVEQALKRQKKILPVVLTSGSLPKELIDVYYADFSKDYSRGFSELSSALHVS